MKLQAGLVSNPAPAPNTELERSSKVYNFAVFWSLQEGERNKELSLWCNMQACHMKKNIWYS